MKEVRTTASGVISIINGVILIAKGLIDGNLDAATISLAITSITTGVGLVFASDAKKPVATP